MSGNPACRAVVIARSSAVGAMASRSAKPSRRARKVIHGTLCPRASASCLGLVPGGMREQEISQGRVADPGKGRALDRMGWVQSAGQCQLVE